jgi:DNA anti-recombination protein RmuC
MRILAIVRDVALIVCAVTLTATTLYFANEYRTLRADLAALRALPAEMRERLRERVEESGERLRDKAGDLQERAKDSAGQLRERAKDSTDQLRERARERFGRDKQD